MNQTPATSSLWPSPKELHQQVDDIENRLTCHLEQADSIQGLLIDLTARGINVLRRAIGAQKPFKGYLVVALTPAGPTRQEDLLELLNLRDEYQGDNFSLELRLLPLPSGVTAITRHAIMPPSSLLLRNSRNQTCSLWLGSNGDLDTHRPYHCASLNLLVPLTPLLADSWQHQFDYVAAKSAPLQATSLAIPALVPAPGELAAAQQWQAYCQDLFAQDSLLPAPEVTIDEKTGEIRAVAADGTPVPVPSQSTGTRPLPQSLREILPVFEQGALASVDETSRIRPLTIPVKSFLFDQQTEKQIGAVKQKQSFTLELLDEKTARETERCRKIGPTLALFSFSLGHGIHWVPNAVRPLLEAERKKMEQDAQAALGAVSKQGVDAWVDSQWKRYENDLRSMYRTLNGGQGEPTAEQMHAVRAEALRRLNAAIKGPLVPSLSYGAFIPEIGQTTDGITGLGKMLELLSSAAVTLRQPYADNFFQRNFSKRVTKLEDWETAMNVLGDTGPARLQRKSEDEAKRETAEIEELLASAKTPEQKVDDLWSIIRTTVENPRPR
jgi:hypothetical protein